MNITNIENVGTLRKYLVKIPSDEIKNIVESKLLEKAKTFQLAGFRTGKVPIAIVRNQLGDNTLQEVVNSKISDSIQEIVSQNKIELFSQPEAHVKSLNQNEEMNIELMFTVWPEIPPIDWQDKKLQDIKIHTLDVTKDDLEKAYKGLAKSTRNFEKTDDTYKARKGDSVIVDYECTIDGEGFDGNKANRIPIIIGDKHFIEDFENQLEGLKKDDKMVIKAKFPDQYHNSTIAGKEGAFSVYVHDIEKAADDNSDNMKYNDAFATKHGFENIKQMEDGITSHMKAEFDMAFKSHIRNAVFDHVKDQCVFDIPDNILMEDYNNLIKNHKGTNGDEKKDEIDDKTKVELYHKALIKGRLALFLIRFAKDHNIVVTKEECINAIEDQKKRSPNTSKDIQKFYDDEQNLTMLQNMMMDNKIMDYILKEKLSSERHPITADTFGAKYASSSTQADQYEQDLLKKNYKDIKEKAEAFFARNESKIQPSSDE